MVVVVVMMMKDRSRFVLLLLFRVSVGVGTEGYETNWLYLIENNDGNLAEKGTHRQIPGMLEGKDKDGGGGGVLLCRRVMIVLSLCIKSGWFHDSSLLFFRIPSVG